MKPYSLRQVGVGLALLVGSYVMSAFVNASPITQPKLSGPSAGRVIVVAPPADDASESAEIPATGIVSSESQALRSL